MAGEQIRRIGRNVLSVDRFTYFGLNPQHFLDAGMKMDSIVSKVTSPLKVKKADYAMASKGNSFEGVHMEKRSGLEYSALLKDYLPLINKFVEEHNCKKSYGGIGNQFHRALNLDYLVDAVTFDPSSEGFEFYNLSKQCLKNSDQVLKILRASLGKKFNKKAVIGKLKKSFEESRSKFPEVNVHLSVIEGILYTPTELALGICGRINIQSMKGKKAEKKAVELQNALESELAKHCGPSLSLDVFNVYNQAIKLHNSAQEVMENYGSVLLTPWRERLFSEV